MTTLTERLETLTPAAKHANSVWATATAIQHLTALKNLLPYNPTLPPEIKQWLLTH